MVVRHELGALTFKWGTSWLQPSTTTTLTLVLINLRGFVWLPLNFWQIKYRLECSLGCLVA